MLPFLDIINHETWSIDRVRSLAETDSTNNNVIDIVLVYLILNTKQRIAICEIMHHIICNQAFFRPKYSDQLLFVIKNKDSISRS